MEDDELGRGSLFATGLIAGGALTGVIVAILAVFLPEMMESVNLEHSIVGRLGTGGYNLMGTLFFIAMMTILYRLAVKKN